MAFEVNQKVVCVIEFKGKYKTGGTILGGIPLPQKGVIYEIEAIVEDDLLVLKELVSYTILGDRHAYDSSKFAPLQYDSALMELAVTFKETIERSDCPVVTPEKIKA